VGLRIGDYDRTFASPFFGSIPGFPVGGVDFREEEELPADKLSLAEGAQLVNPHSSFSGSRIKGIGIMTLRQSRGFIYWN
jgi:hypothetical protein